LSKIADFEAIIAGAPEPYLAKKVQLKLTGSSLCAIPMSLR